MKATIDKLVTEAAFTPITFNLTVESLDEFKCLYILFQNVQKRLEDRSRDSHYMYTPKNTGALHKCFDPLYDYACDNKLFDNNKK